MAAGRKMGGLKVWLVFVQGLKSGGGDLFVAA